MCACPIGSGAICPAQFAAAQVGKRGLEKPGAALRRRRARRLYAGAARLYRAHAFARKSSSLAAGTYRFTDYIDSDGFSDTPIPIVVAITVRRRRHAAGRLHRLFAAGEGRAQFDIELHPFADLSQRALRAWRKDIPNNVGLFRCIDVMAPEASVLNPADAGSLRRPRAHRVSRVRHDAWRAGADRAGAGAGGGRGRQQRDLHQRAARPTASLSSSST